MLNPFRRPRLTVSEIEPPVPEIYRAGRQANFQSAEPADVGLRILQSPVRIRLSSGNTNKSPREGGRVGGFSSASDPRSQAPIFVYHPSGAVQSLLVISTKRDL